MNLKAFHIVFVSASSLLAFMFGGWSLRNFASEDSTGYLVLGILSFLFGVGMIAYGVWFWRKIRTPEEERRRRPKLVHSVNAVTLYLLFALANEPAALACSVCYGEAEGAMIHAARLGVWVLYGMVLMLQASFIAFFVYLARRAKRLRTEEIPPWWSTIG